MRTARMVALMALLSGGIAYGQTKVVYTLELDGNNHADLWEANQAPTFTPGVTSGAITVGTAPAVNKPDLTWAVRVTVGGKQTGDTAAPGYDTYPFGAANLVFDLELYDSTGALVATLGAAPLVASGNQNLPDPLVPGFWSSINDGDSAGTRGGISPDILANAAFAITLWNTDAEPTQKTSLIDPAPTGPNFDYGWYPTANGRSGVDIAGTKTVTAVNNPSIGGKLVGFGAGMKSYDYTNYRPGVGKRYPSYDTPADVFGFGAYLDDTATDGKQDPMNPLGITERALFEGQLSVRGLPNGTYTLKVVPSADGTNVIQGNVEWNATSPNFGSFGSFAVKAQEVYPLATSNPGIAFVVNNQTVIPTAIKTRAVFYNACMWDGNRATIDAAANPSGADDGDAIDLNKSPLMVGGGTSTFANYTSYKNGLNGLVYDVKNATRAPVVTDFTFKFIGKNGLLTPAVVKTPSAFAIWPGAGVEGSDRVFIAFPNYVNGSEANSIGNGWVEVEIGTGFGLAAAEKHYWGNSQGEAQDSATAMVRNALDLSKVKANYTAPNAAPATWTWDFDKNKTCNSLDVSFAKSKFDVPPSNAVQRITR